MNKHYCAIVVLLSVFVFWAQTAPAAETCLKCHAAFKKAKVVHPAVEMGCGSCHEKPHANKKKADLSLTAKVPDLCFTCHDKSGFTKKTIHPPVKNGQCTYCHSPHSAYRERMLTQTVFKLCTGCHEKEASGRHVLASVGPFESHPLKQKSDPNRKGGELSCTSCHNPHSSNGPRLFIGDAADAKSLCLRCHEKVSVKP